MARAKAYGTQDGNTGITQTAHVEVHSLAKTQGEGMSWQERSGAGYKLPVTLLHVLIMNIQLKTIHHDRGFAAQNSFAACCSSWRRSVWRRFEGPLRYLGEVLVS